MTCIDIILAVRTEASAAHSRRLAAIPHVLRWLCEELVNALLRPVFARWRASVRAGAPWSDVYELRFLSLVNAAPCWPCRIEWGGDIAGLCIYSVGGDANDYDLLD